jgi:hypothetical protein
MTETRHEGELWWITHAFEPLEDLCGHCRQRFIATDVPVVMWKQGDDGRTWVTRIHAEPCAKALVALGILEQRSNDNGR